MARTGRRSSGLWLAAAVWLAGLSLTFTPGPPKPSTGSQSPRTLRHAERSVVSGGIQGEEKFDGILDEIAAAAEAEDEARGPLEEPEEDGWAWIKESFGWLLVVDVFTLIALSAWLIVGQTLKWLFDYDPII
ncbi:MDH2, partial [Symbiodinium sp. CCMP2456]